MIISIHALQQLEKINNKAKLESQDFEDAANAIIKIRQDLDDIVAKSNQQATIHAIGNIAKLSSILFSEIRETLDQKSSAVISYETLIKTSDQYFTPEFEEFKNIFTQIDQFRTKYLKNPDLSKKTQQAMLRYYEEYRAQHVQRTSAAEIENIATKIERDMLTPMLLEDGWLDYKATKQSINFLNETLANIQKAIEKNPLLSPTNIDSITKKIAAAKKAFCKRIVKLSPLSEYIVETLDKPNNEAELTIISEHISAIVKTLALERKNLNLNGTIKDRAELAKRLDFLAATDSLNISSNTKKELSKTIKHNIDLFKKTNLIFETQAEIYQAATSELIKSICLQINTTPEDRTIKSAQQFRYDLSSLKLDPAFSMQEKAILHNAEISIKVALKAKNKLDTYMIPSSSFAQNLFASTGNVMKLIVEKTKNSLEKYNSR